MKNLYPYQLVGAIVSVRKSFGVFLTSFLLFIAVFQMPALAQLSGSKSIPGDYASIAAAVADLNTSGVGSGGVTFNVAAGYTESITSGITITTAGSPANPIVFQKSGAGADPLITRTDAGTNTTSALGGLGDAVIRIDGTDNLTFDGIDVAASQSGIEYGYMTSKTATNACQGLTIRNCSVTMTKGTSGFVVGIYLGNGSTSVSSATGVTVTANSGRTENVTIIGNSIQNVHAGIVCRGSVATGFADQNFQIGQAGAGNTITNFGGGSATTTYGVYFIYVNNVNVSNNIIDNAGGGGTAHGSTFYSTFFSVVSGTCSFNNNSLTVSMAGASANYGMYNSNACTSFTINGNSYTSGATFTNTTTAYFIYNNSATNEVTVTNNTVPSFTRTGAGTFYGYYNVGSPTGGTETFTNNSFTNISGVSTCYGYYSNTTISQNRVCHSNTMSNWTSTGITYGIYALSCLSNQVYNNTVSSLNGTSTGSMYGIYVSGTNASVYGNTVHSLSSGGTVLYGIWSAATASASIYKNKIYGLTSNSSGTGTNLSTGIHVSTNATTTDIYNNLIGNLNAPSAASTDAIRGISLSATTAGTSVNISYNTIYINATSTGANFGSTGIFHTSSTTATSSNLTLRNNLVYNNSTPAGTGFTVAYRRSASGGANYNALSDRNMFFAGPASPSNLVFSDGTNLFEDLDGYKAFIVAPDQNSKTEDVSFQSTTSSSADFLKFSTGSPTVCESQAANIAGITDDFGGTVRQGNTGYTGTGSAPDMGAWELNGLAQGGCSGTPPLANTLVSPATPCNGASFTLSLDQTYGLGYSFQWEESTVGASGPYTPIPSATNPTLVTSTTSSEWYRCVVTCVSSGQSTTSAEVAVSFNAMAGSYTIDNTGAGDYLSFQAALGDVNCRGVSAPVIFNVVAGQIHALSSGLEITYQATAANTITFQKSGAGANPKLQLAGTSGATDFILKLTGADYYTFNGIDFEQTGTSSTDWVEYGIWLTNSGPLNGAKNNTFKNSTVTLSSSNTASRCVIINSTGSPTSLDGTQSDNRFLNMTVQNAWEGYRITGASTAFNDNGNEIGTEAGGTSTIQNLGDGATAASLYGVFATYQTNFKLKNTLITNLLPGGTSLVYGVTMQTAATNSAEISGNTISNITGGGTLYGIYFSSADTLDLYNNTIHSFTTTGASSNVRGIYLTATGLDAKIYGNRVYNITSNGASTTSAGGIDVGTGSYAIYNNMVSDIKAPASTNTGAGVRGISVTGGTSGAIQRIYYNTVVLSDVATVVGHTSAALHNSSTTPTLDIRNNIFINNTDISTVGTRVAAFWKTASTDNVESSSNNNIYYAGPADATHLIFYDATNSVQSVSAYAALASIAPGEVNSVAENTLMQPISNGIIRPDVSTPTAVESGAQAIAGYGSDFEGDARNASTPDIGADEGSFTIFVAPVPDCATLLAPANLANDVCPFQDVTLRWAAPVTGSSVTQGYDLYFGTTNPPPFLANTFGTTYTPTGIQLNTTYYWQVVPKNGTGPAVGCTVNSFTTSNAVLDSTSGGSRCGSGTVSLNASGTGTMNWYAASTGGTPLGTGNTFITPVISTTTDYYVAASAGNIFVNGARPAPTGTSTVSAASYGLVFDAVLPFTLNTVDVYATAAGNLVVQLQDNTGATLQSATVAVAAGTTTQAQTITLDFPVPVGTGLRLIAVSSPNMVRESSLGGFPYSLGIFGNITNGFITTPSSTTYYYFYNWSMSSVCETARQMVTATVLPATSNTTTATVCDSYTWSVNNQTYTASGSYSSVTGCHTEILNLTVTPSTTNTTTAAVCDSYTWSVDNQTYSQSGSYTSVNGCQTNILNLTITGVATTNTTSASACGSYTWTVDGQTYSQSGSYTSVSGCNTEILNLTITPITGTSTPITACDTYTWSVSGLTYTQSGTYTSTNVCNTDTLILTITASSSNTTTTSACDSYTWSVNNQNYTQSGTYTATVGCLTEELVLTIIPSSTNTTTATACGSYTWTVNNQTYTQTGTYTAQNGCVTETLELTINPLTSNTTTLSACDSYTWLVTGLTYTQSGTYSSVSGCNTEILTLTITASSSATTTISACDSYLWSVDGQTYSTTGTYTSVSGCATSILDLTIIPTTTNTTTVSACDSYTWSANGVVYTQSGTYTASSANQSGGMRISQVYGGGGGSTGTYLRDYVELYNSSCSPINIGGWSIAYGSATGNFGSSASNVFTFPAGTTVAPKKYLLIECGASGSAGTALPVTADFSTSTSSFSMSGTSGKVGLFNTTVSNIACSSLVASTVVDKVSWGTANCAEGSAVSAPTTSQVMVRALGGETDSDNNNADFTNTSTSVALPRNSSSPSNTAVPCLAPCTNSVLVLTITPSSSNTTTASACDSYTWSVNGVTYTQSGTYSSVTGCATEVLVLTITPSSSNTTTASACDSYTWSVNGATYTQSGTFSSVIGCATEVLVLTITPSSSNTTTTSACDSYNWSVNGVTYTQSGTYSNVTGCATEVLVLTITPSSSNTTTASACDSYTWSVNGATYTQSGTFSSVTGCATEVLVLTITPSSSNTTTASACDSYTWSVNGVAYTQSGTYSSVNGCATEVLVLTISPSSSNTTTASSCDSYTWSVNGVTYTQSGTYSSVTGCATEVLVLTITPSSSNTTTASGCDSYTWSTNGVMYTQSGTYSSTSGCVSSTLVLNITTSTTYYADLDGDGYGDASSPTTSCSGTPTGYVSVSGDCNDNNDSVNPGATEICNSIDDDCDGQIDEGVAPISTGTITGPVSSCMPGVSGTASFTVSGISSSNGFAWTVPSGFTITAGQGTATITVTYSGAAVQSGIAGSLCATSTNACGSLVPTCVNIDYQVAAPVTPPSISGPSKACVGETLTYSTASVARATSYTWSTPAGMSILSGQGSNIISVSVSGGYVGGTLSVSASNVCGTSPLRSKVLNVNPPLTPSAIQGAKSGLCSATGVTYSIPSVSNATSYLWSVSGGGVIVSGQGTLSIVVDYPVFTSGSVSVQAVNGCGTSLQRSISVSGAPGRPGSITGPLTACVGDTSDYSIATVDGTGAGGYNWIVTQAGTIVSGQGTKNTRIRWFQALSNQSIAVSASNACGTSTRNTLAGVTVAACPRLSTDDMANGLDVYPNPAYDRTHYRFVLDREQAYVVRLIDLSGRVLDVQRHAATVGIVDGELYLGALPNGVYQLEIHHGDKTSRVKLVISR